MSSSSMLYLSVNETCFVCSIKIILFRRKSALLSLNVFIFNLNSLAMLLTKTLSALDQITHHWTTATCWERKMLKINAWQQANTISSYLIFGRRETRYFVSLRFFSSAQRVKKLCEDTDNYLQWLYSKYVKNWLWFRHTRIFLSRTRWNGKATELGTRSSTVLFQALSRKPDFRNEFVEQAKCTWINQNWRENSARCDSESLHRKRLN